MNEQVRENIKKIIYDTCNSMRHDYPAGWDKIAGEGVDRISALWPKPLDVEEVFDFLTENETEGEIDCCVYQTRQSKSEFTDAITARFCAPVAETPDIAMIRQFEYNRGYEDAQNEPTMTISTTAAPQERVWISVDERLPEDYMPVLWCRHPVEEPYWVGSMCDDGFEDGYYTHWMPLPEPPAAK